MLTSANRTGPVVIVGKDIKYAFPFWAAYLSGYLREHDEEVLIRLRPENDRFFRSFARELIALKPLLVGFGSLYPDLYPVKEIIAILDAEGRNFPIVIGGQMVSPTPEFAVKITGADIGVIGEGEIILHNLVGALREGNSLLDVRGLAVRDGEEVTNTGPGAYIEDLRYLPKIPYDLFPTEKWLEIGKFYATERQPFWRYTDRVISIHGGRGCPYTCNFCYHSSKARYRPVADMMLEADEMLKRFDGNILYFGDDLVLSTPKRAAEFVEAIPKLSRPVEYSVSSRFNVLDRMDDTLLREMKRTGCRIMGIGIESGSQRMLDVMGKNITVDQIKRNLSRLRDVGILPTGAIMVGQLSETAEDAELSLQMIREITRDNKFLELAFCITTPFPGTDLYATALKEGLIRDDLDFFNRFDPFRQWNKVTVNMTAMSDEEVLEWKARMEETFKRETRRVKGPLVIVVGYVRRFFGQVHNRLLQTLFADGKPKGVVGAIMKPYLYGYDALQMALDRIRWALLGVNRQ